MTITLEDPISGSKVLLKKAELPQKCGVCREQLLGLWIAHVVDSGRGWCCLRHVSTQLMTMPPSPQLVARRAVAERLKDAVPGDVTTVTRVLLAAVRP